MPLLSVDKEQPKESGPSRSYLPLNTNPRVLGGPRYKSVVSEKTAASVQVSHVGDV